MSENTFNKMIITSDDSNSAIMRGYPMPQAELWDENFVNGEYVIAYELSSGLHPDVQSMLPKVNHRFRSEEPLILRTG